MQQFVGMYHRETDIGELRREWIQLRALKKLSQEEAAELIGVSQGTVSGFESGSIPRDATLVALQQCVRKWKNEEGSTAAEGVMREPTAAELTPRSRRWIQFELDADDIGRMARMAWKVERFDLRDKLDELAHDVDLMREEMEERITELQSIERTFRSLQEQVQAESSKRKPTKPRTLRPQKPRKPEM